MATETISAAVYSTHGNPAEVLRVETQPWPRPGRGEVVVRMKAAPINPADLNQIEGKYPVKAELPATPGFEGAGVVAELGEKVSNLTIGALVLLPHNLGTWREAAAVEAGELVAVPSGVDPVQAAMLKINPLTAWRLLHGYVKLEHDEWVIQNAANSAAGRAVIQIARELGYKTVNVVRREELIDELKAEGGDVVLVDGEKLRDQVREQSGGAKIKLGLNAVGGDNALRLANCLAPGGTLVSFGAMSLQPLKIPTGLFIFKDLRFRGIWINKWYDNATQAERIATLGPIFEMAKRGVLKTKVESLHPLSDYKAAVTRAGEGKRNGKIVFKFGD
jgi:trans-2-enoyl-CoA reductase